MADTIDEINLTFNEAIIIIAGDFNQADTTFLECDYAFNQLVASVTHGRNILDKVFVNQTDLFVSSVFDSLIKTKHKAVLIHSDNCQFKRLTSEMSRRKTRVYDLKPHNIDALRAAIGNYDWSDLLSCNDVQIVYDQFAAVIPNLIDNLVPSRMVRLGPRDPEFMTPVIKGMLRKRTQLMKKGRLDEANSLAEKINKLIQATIGKRLANISSSKPKDLWKMVNKSKTKKQSFISSVSSEELNAHFANIAFDPAYDVNDTLQYTAALDKSQPVNQFVSDFEVEMLLRKVHSTSPGPDPFPVWLFQLCSVEVAGVVAHILNCSFTYGTVPSTWRQAIVTPVPKTQQPKSLNDFRPISVTPILSRIAEKFIVRKWLRPNIPRELLDDQFGFRVSGSTTCAMTYFFHHITRFLENNDYVRCLMIDFSKAFDTINHAVLMSKIAKLNIPPYINNWIISFLTNRSQVCKLEGALSSSLPVNLSIVQGSGIGPTLYCIQESDLRALSLINLLMKYADDTNLLVPCNTDVQIDAEFDNIQTWAVANKMTINVAKTKEIVFRRPSARCTTVLPPMLPCIERVKSAKLLGVFITDNLKFGDHVNYVLQRSCQRLYLLKLLRCQGLSLHNLSIVCVALLISRLTYAISAWGGFCSASDVGRINSFLKRVVKYGFLTECSDFNSYLDQADLKLFKRMCHSDHCLHMLLPALKPTVCQKLRRRTHVYTLPKYRYELFKKSFVLRCLYNF